MSIDIEELKDELMNNTLTDYDEMDHLLADTIKALEQQQSENKTLVNQLDGNAIVLDAQLKELKRLDVENKKLAGTVEDLALELGKNDDLIEQLKKENESSQYLIPSCQCECHQDGSCGFYHCFSECCNNMDYKFINKDGSIDGLRYSEFLMLKPPEFQS